MLIELNEDKLQDIVASHDKVIVQYSASWCGNCRIMKPKFKKFASEVGNVTFVLVDAEQSPESRKLANVTNLPTFAAFSGGQLLDQAQTNKTEVLEELVHKIAQN